MEITKDILFYLIPAMLIFWILYYALDLTFKDKVSRHARRLVEKYVWIHEKDVINPKAITWIHIYEDDFRLTKKNPVLKNVSTADDHKAMLDYAAQMHDNPPGWFIRAGILVSVSIAMTLTFITIIFAVA